MRTKVKYTHESIKADAKKYNSRGEWCKNSPAYYAAHKRGILDECCAHMSDKYQRKNGVDLIWTMEACINDAQQYRTKAEWRRRSNSAVKTAYRKGWIEQCCKHMK